MLLPEMLLRWKRKHSYTLMAVLDHLSLELWERYGLTFAAEYVIPPSVMEGSVSLKLVPLLYLRRLLVVVRQLGSLPVPDVIYTSSDYFTDIVPALLLRTLYRSRGIKWMARVYHVVGPPGSREGGFLQNFAAFVEQRVSLWMISSFADRVVTMAGTYDELSEMGFPTAKLAISNAGVELAEAQETRSSEQKFDAVSICRIHPTKGIWDLVDIWHGVTKTLPSARLAIIGGGPDHLVKELRTRIEERGLSESVVYLGYLPTRSEVFGVLKGSGMYLDAEHEDGWSLAVCEAMACGLPVVSYKLHMFNKAFKQGVVLVPLRDVKGFSNAVTELLLNSNQRSRLSEESLIEVKKYTWDSVAEDMYELIVREVGRDSPRNV